MLNLSRKPHQQLLFLSGDARARLVYRHQSDGCCRFDLSGEAEILRPDDHRDDGDRVRLRVEESIEFRLGDELVRLLLRDLDHGIAHIGVVAARAVEVLRADESGEVQFEVRGPHRPRKPR